jgi:cobalt-zinc-cadmium efflux system protein
MNNLIFIAVLALLGGLVKIIGGYLSGSRALIVDALTSFANIFTLGVSIHYFLHSLKPPDVDHHYGHARLNYLGMLSTMLTYSFVAGTAVTLLIYSWNYHVEFIGVYTAVIGFLIYSLVVYLSYRVGGIIRIYGFFTVSELIESIVTIIASLGGSLYSFVIDYIGGVILTLYIFVELYHTFRKNIIYLTDISPNNEIIQNILSYFRRHGIEIERYRFRIVYEDYIHGDIMVKPGDCSRIVELLRKLSRIEGELKRKYPKLDLLISINYNYCRG